MQKSIFSALFISALFIIIITVIITSGCLPKAGQPLEQQQSEHLLDQGNGEVIDNVQSSSIEKIETANALTGVQYSIDTTQSIVTRAGTKVIGGGHNGTVGISEGLVLINDNRIVGGEVIINMNAITVSDIPAGDSRNVRLVNHLLGPDFFDVKQFPTAQFVVTSVNNDNFPRIEVTGTMTIKDQSHSETVIIEVNEDMTQLSGSMQIDRTKYGVMYNSEKLLQKIKDRAIGDMITLGLTLTLVKE